MIRATNETSKSRHTRDLLNSFFFFVCGGRECDRPREDPPKEDKTARREGFCPSNCRDRFRFRYRTTTTVYSQYERREESSLSVRERGIEEVIA